MARNKNDFNKLIFKAINIITSNGGKASLSQIRSYFEKNNISKMIKSGETLNLKYLNLLVNRHYLELKEIDNITSNQESFTAYFLTLKARDLLKKNGLLDKESLEDHVAPNGSEGLIKCPNQNCGYFCQPSWKNCPICYTKLDQDILITRERC